MKKYCLHAVIFLLFAAACMKPADLQKNPNKATEAAPGSVLTGVEQDMFLSQWGDAQRSSQYYCITNAYYGKQSYAFGSASHRYYQIRNVMQMEKEAKRTGGPNMRAYFAIGLFLRAWFFIQMSVQMGDVPMSQAMMAEQGIIAPVYDTQRDVYLQCLNLLHRANDSLAVLNREGGMTVDGDVFFKGDLDRWQRAVNAFRLRVLISLSKKTADAGMKIPETFAHILANPAQCPLPRSNADNLVVNYSDASVQNYNPAYSVTPEASSRNNPLAATFVSLMVELKDPRLFVVALPSQLSDSLPENTRDFRSYRGASTGTLQKPMSDSAAAGYYSHPDPAYWFASKTGQPTVLHGYPEVQFSIAEAINRGWVSGNAEDYYEAGIRASMQRYNLPGNAVSDYMAQASVQYAGNNENGLKQILLQKYIDFFQMGGWESFYNQRRTGIPVFATGPSNENGGKIPLRWFYPPYEYIDNGPNLQAALNRQYGGLDQLNGRMWLLQ